MGASSMATGQSNGQGPARGLQTAGREELKRQAIELRAEGLSMRRIATRLKIGRSTVSGWLRDAEAEIAALRAIELEALYESAHMTKEARVKRLAGQIAAIEKEVKSRGLADVPTDKLLRLLLEYHEALKQEHTEIRPLPEGLRAENRPEMDSGEIKLELERVLERLRAGLTSPEQARHEQSLLRDMLKAIEQVELAEKLVRLEAILDARTEPGVRNYAHQNRR